MRLGYVLFLCFSTLYLTACSSGPSEKEFSPKIGEIYTNVIHFHPSYYSKKASDFSTGLGFTVSVAITDPEGISDLNRVYVEDTNTGLRWFLLNPEHENPWKACHVADGLFQCRFADPLISPDSIILKGFEIAAVDFNGYKTVKAFEFKLPDGEIAENELFVYSSNYSESTQNGIEALEVMTIEDNELAFSVDNGAQSIQIEFIATDDRVRDYSISLYDDSDEVELIGTVCSCSSSIRSSTPVVLGQKTIVDIPYSEIEFTDNYGSSDIKGVHIVLLDESVEWTQGVEGSEWFNYQGYSEFLSLASE